MIVSLLAALLLLVGPASTATSHSGAVPVASPADDCSVEPACIL
jgi:hypothetical protein